MAESKEVEVTAVWTSKLLPRDAAYAAGLEMQAAGRKEECPGDAMPDCCIMYYECM